MDRICEITVCVPGASSSYIYWLVPVCFNKHKRKVLVISTLLTLSICSRLWCRCWRIERWYTWNQQRYAFKSNTDMWTVNIHPIFVVSGSCMSLKLKIQILEQILTNLQLSAPWMKVANWNSCCTKWKLWTCKWKPWLGISTELLVIIKRKLRNGTRDISEGNGPIMHLKRKRNEQFCYCR